MAEALSESYLSALSDLSPAIYSLACQPLATYDAKYGMLMMLVELFTRGSHCVTILSPDLGCISGSQISSFEDKIYIQSCPAKTPTPKVAR